jgi:hypothetical protein
MVPSNHGDIACLPKDTNQMFHHQFQIELVKQQAQLQGFSQQAQLPDSGFAENDLAEEVYSVIMKYFMERESILRLAYLS